MAIGDAHKHKFAPHELAKRLRDMGAKFATLFFWFPDPNVDIGKKFHLVYGKDVPGHDGKTYEELVTTGYFHHTIPAPLWQEIIDWLYADHGIFITFQDDTHAEPKPWPSGFRFYVSEYAHCVIGLANCPYYKTTDEALQAAITQSIEYIEKELTP